MATHTRRHVTYLLTDDDGLAPGDAIVRTHEEACAAASAIQLCREVPRDARPGDLPPLAASEGGVPVVESWATTAEWLVRSLGAFPPDLMARLIVRVGWPISGDVETSVLLARLEHPALRIAVELRPDDAVETFHYMNRLGFSWIALPPASALPTGWGDVLRRLSDLWCFDPRIVTPVEPFMSAFHRALRRRAEPDQPDWECRVVRVSTPARAHTLGWSPTLHALLVAAPARARALPLDQIAGVDRGWDDELAAQCERVDVHALEPLARRRTAQRRQGVA